MSEKITEPCPFPAPVGGCPDWLIVAGEHSGDEHAARLVAGLRTRRPDSNIACLGGSRLQRAGAQLLYDMTQVSVVGFVEVIRRYGFFKTLFDHTLDWIERYRPRHICFVDYPGFNLRLASRLYERGLSRKGGGEIDLSYYIGPQIWAWKAKRRFKMERTLDRLGVIFPFEVECYADTKLPVEFIGHPFVRKDHRPSFIHDAHAPVLLLPGSRVASVRRIFPILMKGFRQAGKTKPELTARVLYPSERIRSLLDTLMDAFPDMKNQVAFSPNQAGDRLPAQAVLMSSGTMSLDVALSGIPGAIAYRLNPLSYRIGRCLVKTPFIGISNLLLERPLYPEYIQSAATPKRLASELLRACQVEAAEEAARGAEAIRRKLNPRPVPTSNEADDMAVDWLERAGV